MEVAYSLTGQRKCPKVDRKLGHEEGLPTAKISAKSMELQWKLALGSGLLWRVRHLPRNKSTRIPGHASADSFAGLSSPDGLCLLWKLSLDCPCQGRQECPWETRISASEPGKATRDSPRKNGSDFMLGTSVWQPLLKLEQHLFDAF